jgi:hypothetical protein
MYKKDMGNGCYKIAELNGNEITEKYYGRHGKLVDKQTYKPFCGTPKDILVLKGFKAA